MIRLRSAKREGDRIVCLGYVEDCKVPVHIAVKLNGESESGELPEGYEYCTSHIRQGERYLLKREKEGTLSDNMLVMWY